MTKFAFHGGYPAGQGTCEVCQREMVGTIIVICDDRFECARVSKVGNMRSTTGRHRTCLECPSDIIAADSPHLVRCPDRLTDADRTLIALRRMA